MDIARMNNSLGCLYLDMGKYEEAGQLLNNAYLAFRKSFDDKSIEVRAAKASLAQYDFYTGSYDRALKETEEIIEISNRKKDKAVIATTSHFRATVLNSLGRYDEALALYEEVLLLYEDIEKNKSQSMDLAQYTNDSSIADRKREYYKTAAKWVVLSRANMGATHLRAGDAQAAHTELTKALEYCLNTWFIGQKTLMTADIYCNLAIAKQQLGDTRGAMNDAETAIAVQRGLFDYTDDYAGLTVSYRVLAGIQSATGGEAALAAYQKSLELALRDYGEHHPQTALSCQALGVFFLEQGDFAQALEYLERALDIRKSILLTKDVDTLTLYQYLRQASEALGEQSKEQAYANEARALEEAINV
jgi:tetratricopeptide (TPR) repeat protein